MRLNHLKRKLFLILFIFIPSMTKGDDKLIRQCIAQHLGAGSVNCLKKLYYVSTKEIITTESQIKSVLKKRKTNGDLTSTHYESAMVEFKKSSSLFNKYRDRTCYFVAYTAGGVASGYLQKLYSCLIDQNDRRVDFLNYILNFSLGKVKP